MGTGSGTRSYDVFTRGTDFRPFWIFHYLDHGIVLSFDAWLMKYSATIDNHIHAFSLFICDTSQSVLRVRRTSPRIRNSVSHAVSFDNATSARNIFHPSECDTLPFHASSSPYSLLWDTILKQCSYPYMIYIRIGFVFHSKPPLHEQLIRYIWPICTT